MGWVEWGHWGLVAVIGGAVFWLALTDNRLSKAGARATRRYYLYKYGTFLVLASLFMVFLERLTGMESNLKWVFGGLGAIPAVLMGLLFVGRLPQRFGGWLDQVPGGKK